MKIKALIEVPSADKLSKNETPDTIIAITIEKYDELILNFGSLYRDSPGLPTTECSKSSNLS
jgi:hypothetical protein